MSQANRGISKETSVTYSHAVHGVLKELVAKRIKDGRAGPTSSMNADVSAVMSQHVRSGGMRGTTFDTSAHTAPTTALRCRRRA
eukprot:29834-Eustigmatos_ZCMA.PRE.1